MSKKRDSSRRLDSGDGAKKIEQEKTVSTAPHYLNARNRLRTRITFKETNYSTSLHYTLAIINSANVNLVEGFWETAHRPLP